MGRADRSRTTARPSIWGDATASGSTGCSTAGTSYTVIGGTVYGDVTACGKIQSVLGYNSASPGIASTAPALQTLPSYTYVDANYPGQALLPEHGDLRDDQHVRHRVLAS